MENNISDCVDHPILTPIASFFELYSNDAEMINKFSLPINTNYEKYFGNVDWEKMDSRHTLCWSQLSEEDLSLLLQKTVLCDYNEILIQLHYGFQNSCTNCIFRIPTSIFIKNWESILIASSVGFLLTTSNQRYVIEILNKQEVIYSNFKI